MQSFSVGWFVPSQGAERVFTVRDIQEHVDNALRLLDTLEEAARELTDAIGEEAGVKARYREANDYAKLQDALCVVAAEAESAEKRGPLAGIAKTSKAYDYALQVVLEEGRKGKQVFGDVADLRGALEAAEARREQAATKFSAVKAASGLMSHVLLILNGGE
jgi:hypothetical protein